MKVIVVGCGRLGIELSHRLFLRGHEVTVVDNTASAFNNLPEDFKGRTVEGEALNQDVLIRAGIATADGMAVVTNSDALNATVAHIARSEYHLENVVVRNYNPLRRTLFEAFGQQIISSTSWGAQRIEEMIYAPDVRTVFSAGNGEVEIYEFRVPQAWQGRRLADVKLASSCLPVSITRAGRALLPSPDLVIEQNDMIYISCTLEGIEAFRSEMKKNQEA
jgi:trk system potassium uptake protein TrkA